MPRQHAPKRRRRAYMVAGQPARGQQSNPGRGDVIAFGQPGKNRLRFRQCFRPALADQAIGKVQLNARIFRRQPRRPIQPELGTRFVTCLRQRLAPQPGLARCRELIICVRGIRP